jgi:hypothetical protein
MGGIRRQMSDYGQAVCTGILRARQGAGGCVLDRTDDELEGASALVAAVN